MRAADVADVFVYTVVIGLFVEFFPKVISESFVLTLLTAVLLKLVLELVLAAKKALLGNVRGNSAMSRVISLVSLLVLLPLSKFVVLELTALVFRGSVSLGNFIQVTVLIVTLMLARGATRRLLREPAS